jgi:hypothetical protein
MRRDYKWQASLIVTLGLFMAILDDTIVSVTLPQMLKAFHTDFETITWVVTGLCWLLGISVQTKVL